MDDDDSNDESYDNSGETTKYKIIFVGDAGVGKTSIINRMMRHPYSDSYEPSIGVDFISKNIKFRGQNIKLQIWDTAGQEKYKGLIPSYVRNSSIVFVVYDISVKSTFQRIPTWLNFIRQIESTTLVLCGNKIDLDKKDREVTKEEGEAFAQKEGITFFETSAKTDENIKNMFYSSIADLPTFSAKNLNKENLIKELIEENYVDKPDEPLPGGVNQIPSEQKINVAGEEKKANGETTEKSFCFC